MIAVATRRRLGVAALVVAALSLGRVVQTAFEVDSSIEDPFEKAGRLGEDVALRYGHVSADAVTGSTLIASDGMQLTTSGVWLVVPVTITPVDEPLMLMYAAVRDAEGRVYRADGSRSSFRAGTAQAGVERYATVAVELPVDAAVGAELLLAKHDWDLRWDDLAVIDLEVTQADVDQWAASTELVTVTPSSDRRPDGQS